MSTIKQAIALCWVDTLNLVPVIYGPPGWTKSATIKSLAVDLGLPLFDLRLSDKEPADLGGIPFPIDREYKIDGKVVPRKVLDYLANARLPWADLYGDDFQCILFIDEVDRATQDVLNVALQLFLDRGVNGRSLSSGVRIVAAGNGVTDIGTTELSTAALTRLVQFYVKTDGPEALSHWREWAADEGIDPAMVGFSGFRPEAFGCKKWDYVETQNPNPRTWTWASQAVQVFDELPPASGFGPDVREAIVFGLVGQAAGLEYLAYRRVLHNCATFESVVSNPDGAVLPPADNLGVVYALGVAFTARLYDGEGAKANPENPASGEPSPANTEAVAKYFARVVETFPETREAVAWWFTTASKKLASLRSLPEFTWVINAASIPRAA
jgi:hypothetical protein